MFNFHEDLLQYNWKLQYFNSNKLQTTAHQNITILSPGIQNFDSGPDFSQAKIKIGDTTWVGNVEIHIKSSDWIKHQHFKDPSYDNVILHVVFQEDEKIVRPDGGLIPCIELNGRIKRSFFEKYSILKNAETWIPCSNSIHMIDKSRLGLFLEKLSIERLELKTKLINDLLVIYEGDWEQVLYLMTGKYFGANKNSLAFELLCKSLPRDIILKNRDNHFIIEALFFGQAGMLNQNFEESYPQALKSEYLFLKKKYGLKPIDPKLWKFFRLRPQHFPTLRIAQLSRFVIQSDRLFSKIIYADSLAEIRMLFEFNIKEYWDSHYRFGKESHFKPKKLGKTLIDTIIINAFVPLLFLFGKSRGDDLIIEKAICIFQELDAEMNHNIGQWKKLGIHPANASHSQALLHLKSNYCDKKRCLECNIGHEILNLLDNHEEKNLTVEEEALFL